MRHIYTIWGTCLMAIGVLGGPAARAQESGVVVHAYPQSPAVTLSAEPEWHEDCGSLVEFGPLGGDQVLECDVYVAGLTAACEYVVEGGPDSEILAFRVPDLEDGVSWVIDGPAGLWICAAYDGPPEPGLWCVGRFLVRTGQSGSVLEVHMAEGTTEGGVVIRTEDGPVEAPFASVALGVGSHAPQGCPAGKSSGPGQRPPQSGSERPGVFLVKNPIQRGEAAQFRISGVGPAEISLFGVDGRRASSVSDSRTHVTGRSVCVELPGDFAQGVYYYQGTVGGVVSRGRIVVVR